MTHAFFVGSGIIEKSWTPIIRAICSVHPSNLKSLTNEGANSFLANVVYKTRFFSDAENKSHNEPYEIALNDLNIVRNAIAKEINNSQTTGELTVRKQFEDVVEKLVLPDCTCFIIFSTNWDILVDEAINNVPTIKKKFNKIETVHLHGSYQKPNTLYLPTEVIEEPYRSTDEKMEMGITHRNTMTFLKSCNKIVLYGLSVSPLDAELLQTISSGFNTPNLKNIVIVDPCHKSVAEKINLLLVYPTDVSIHGYDPSDLTKKFGHKL